MNIKILNNMLETVSFQKGKSFQRTEIDFPENYITWVISLTEKITVRTIIVVENTSVLWIEQCCFLVYLKKLFLMFT